MIELNDKLFLALAKKAGFPSRQKIKLCQERKGERTLFETAVAESALDADQAKKFERWAKQVKKGDLAPLEGPDVSSSSTTGSSADRTGSTAKTKAASAGASAGSKTPSAGKTVATVKPPAKRRKLRQSSAEMPAVAACDQCGGPLDEEASTEERTTCATCVAAVAESRDESTHDTVGTPDAPAPAKKALSNKKGSVGSTASAGGVPARAPSSNNLLVVAGAALVASACVGVALYAVTQKKHEPEKSAAATPEKPKAQASTGPVVVEVKPAARAKKARSTEGGVVDDEQVNRAVKTANQLEKEGREDEAVLALDAVLENAQGEQQEKLIDAKNNLVSRLRDQIDKVKDLALAGKRDEAKKLLASLRGHYPESMNGDLDDADRMIVSREAAEKAAAEKASKPTDAPGAKVATPEKPKAPEKQIPTDPAARAKWEVAELGKARLAVTAALALFDVATARGAVESAGPFQEKDTTTGIALERKRVEAIAKLLAYAAGGLKTIQGSNVDLEQRDGTHFTGKLARVDGLKATVNTPAGEVPVVLDALVADPILKYALIGANDDTDGYFFARGVLLACLGDKKGSIEALALAPGVSEAGALKQALEGNDPTFAPAPKKGAANAPIPGTTEKAKDGPVIAGGKEEDDNKPVRPKSWMDDTEGGVDWDKAQTYETEHYIIHTNVKRDYVEKYKKILEGIAKRYTKIFEFSGNNFAYQKNEVYLYKSQEEFMQYEQMPPNVGGFYNPGDKKLHLFHGPWKGAEEVTTLSVMAHEAVHQFENLVLTEMGHAPTFVIEGFSTFAEGTIITKDNDVIVGPISDMRLKTMRRAFKAKNALTLKELIRTQHAEFSGFHYAHTWGLFHWAFFGPESGFDKNYKPLGKSVKFIMDYWQMCLSKQTGAKDFEALLKQDMGWDMDKLEKAWKDWILSLDTAKDPQIENYERQTHKKVVSGF